MRDLTHLHCIVGAGFSGLAAAGALRRAGIPYEQLEADDAIGGNWYHGVYETAHIISSCRTTEYADFPMPADYPDFPSAAQMLRYLNAYADHLDLRGSIELGTRVEWIAPGADGTWEVTLGSGEQRRYGGVVVANGHHWHERWPEYPGEFTGEVIHSKRYKRPDILRGKRVLVVGGGNSGCDIAVEAARFGRESHISLRRGYWFMPKTIAGIPSVEYLRPWMPAWVQVRLFQLLLRFLVGPYSRYGLEEPRHSVFSRHPTINSQLLYFLKHGTITPHKDIARLDGRGVEFSDGERIEVDLLVYATGFHVSIPFLAPEVVRWEGGYPDLINGMFPQRHRNLYVLGIGQVRYGAGPILTAAASFLAKSIQAQARLRHPLGRVLSALGRKPLTNYLMDPHRTLREIRRGSWALNHLHRFEPWLVREAPTAHVESPPEQSRSLKKEPAHASQQ